MRKEQENSSKNVLAFQEFCPVVFFQQMILSLRMAHSHERYYNFEILKTQKVYIKDVYP